MAVYAIRRENETVEKLISRYKKQVQGVRLIQQVREKRYWKKSPSKRLIRISALKRSSNRARRRAEMLD